MPYKDPAKKRACGLRWYYKHHEQEKAKSRRRSIITYAKNPEKGRQYARTYREQYPERVTASLATYRAKKRAERLLAQQQWTLEHAEEVAAATAKAQLRRKQYLHAWGIVYRAKKKALRTQMDPQLLTPILQAEREYQRLYQQGRRALRRALPATFTKGDEHFMLQYWGFACAACGNQEGFQWFLALDQWIPIVSPECPGTVATNIVPLCHGTQGCNNTKSGREAEEWLLERFGPRKAKAIKKKIEAYFVVVKARQETSSGAAD